MRTRRWPAALVAVRSLSLADQRSYTRQPVAEIHTLGSPPLLRRCSQTVCRAGAGLAEPGEFTLRAFLAGRLDLTQAEAVLGVIDAQHEDQLHTAVEQLAGGLAKPLHALRDELLTLLAELEAGLDFVEEDIEFISATELTARLHAAADQIRSIAEQMSSRLTVNTSCARSPHRSAQRGQEQSIQRVGRTIRRWEHGRRTGDRSHVRGTTRDYLTTTIELDGLRCELVDTAGVESTVIPSAHPSTPRPNCSPPNDANAPTSRALPRCHRGYRRAVAAIGLNSTGRRDRVDQSRPTFESRTRPPGTLEGDSDCPH